MDVAGFALVREGRVVLMNYMEAAEVARSENPDGWYADPEAMLALAEFAWEQEKFEGVERVETYRAAWRRAHAKFLDTGQAHYAAECVAIEKEVAA